MAVMPSSAAAGAGFSLSSAGSFLVNMGVSYLISRATAQDGPRLQNTQADGGEYGVPMPRLYGGATRITCVFMAQDDIKETKHTVEDYSELVGAATGAIQGFMIGGPVGAVVGAIAGGLLGAATPNQHYYTYSDTFALLLADRTDQDPVEGIVKLWANGKLIFSSSQTATHTEFGTDGKLVRKKWGKNRWFKSLTLHTGHTEQEVDSVLAANVDEDGAYPFTAYLTVEDLQLAQFGNSVPSPEALVQAKNGETFADFAEMVATAAGIDATRNISTTALVGHVLRGYALTSEVTCFDALKPLFAPFRVDAAEAAGQIRFYRRAQAMRATIPATDLAGHAYGDEPPEPIRFKRTNDLSLPKETALTFSDPARDYQPNTVTSQRSEGDASSNVSIQMQLALTADEAATAVSTIHWDSWLGRTPVTFSLTDQWIGIEPGCAYGIAVAGQVVPFRLTRKLRGANGVIECEAVSDESVTYTGTVAGTSGTIPDEESTEFPDTRVVFIDMPILMDDHDDFGFYLAYEGTETYWTRGRVEISWNGSDYATLLDLPTAGGIIGDVVGTLAAGTTDGLDDTLDTTSVLEVELLNSNMELASATDAELDAWANFAYVGKDGQGEYIQFKTATQTGPTTWELTNLRRGRKGTDWAISTHTSGEEFALLQSGTYARVVYGDETEWGDTIHLRGVTLLQDVADADIQDVVNTGEGKRPYSPVNVEGSWDGSNNLTITWDARSRMNAGGLGEDDQNNYEVEIITGAGRVITATGVESASYSAADQTTDGITPGDSLQGRVRQLSDVNDGRWRDFILLGPADRRADTTFFTADTTAATADIAP